MKRGYLLTTLMALAVSASLIAQPAEVKDPTPPAGDTVGSPAEATGGPDAFGYTYADSAEPNCTYQFVDIAATGTFLFDGDDTSSGPVALTEPIDIYGTSFSDIVMTSNGYMSTDATDTGPDLSNDCPLPAAPSTGGGARLYPLHDDLDLETGIGSGLAEYFAECPRVNDRCPIESCTVFQWDDVAHFPGGVDEPTWDMEVILYHKTNDIVYQIGAGNMETGSGSTTGLQDFPPPTTGLTYACDTAGSVLDDSGVCILHPNPVPDDCFPEIPSPVEVPTANNLGLLALFLGLAAAAIFVLRRRLA